MTEQEKADKRATIKALMDATFGAGHGCNADINGMFRVDGDTTVRFAHNGAYWDLKSRSGAFEIVQVGG